MAVTPDATSAAVVGGVAALLTTLVSKWIDGRAVDRRDAHESRRARDRQQRREMEECERENDELRDSRTQLQIENASLRSILVAKDIPLPDFLSKQIP